jgi:uncharacterized protein YcsI (UPF0317 family)
MHPMQWILKDRLWHALWACAHIICCVVDKVTDISGLWREDFVAFFLGCSFSFEAALDTAGLPIRHIEEGKNVPMYKTNIPCRPAGEEDCRDLIILQRPYHYYSGTMRLYNLLTRPTCPAGPRVCARLNPGPRLRGVG